MDTLAFGYILPTTGRIPDLHRLETCAAGRTRKRILPAPRLKIRFLSFFSLMLPDASAARMLSTSMTAAVSAVMLSMVIAAHVGIVIQVPFQKCFHCRIRIAGHSAVQSDPG